MLKVQERPLVHGCKGVKNPKTQQEILIKIVKLKRKIIKELKVVIISVKHRQLMIVWLEKVKIQKRN